MRFRVHLIVLLASVLVVGAMIQLIRRHFTRGEKKLYYNVRLLAGAVESAQIIIEGRRGPDQTYLVLVPANTGGRSRLVVELRTVRREGFRYIEVHTMHWSHVTPLQRDGAYDVWKLQSYSDGSDTISVAFEQHIFGSSGRETDVSITYDFANFSAPADLFVRPGEGVRLSNFVPLPDSDSGRWLSYHFPAIADGKGVQVEFVASDGESVDQRDFQIFIYGIFIGVFLSLATTAFWDMLITAGRLRRDV